VDAAGNVYVAGYAWTGSTNVDDMVTLKYNSGGTLQWDELYNGPRGNGSDQAEAMVVTPEGNVYVTGWSYGISTNTDYVPSCTTLMEAPSVGSPL
jgi:hypothetical protein